MQITTYRGEKSLGDLARRLFVIERPGSTVKLRRASEALLQANPHLAKLADLAEGVLIVVPEVEGLKPISQPQPTPVPANLVFAIAQEALGSIFSVLQSAAEHRVEAARIARAQAGLATDGSVAGEPGDESEDREEMLKRVVIEADARLAEANAFMITQADVTAQMKRELNNLDAVFSVTSWANKGL